MLMIFLCLKATNKIIFRCKWGRGSRGGSRTSQDQHRVRVPSLFGRLRDVEVSNSPLKFSSNTDTSLSTPSSFLNNRKRKTVNLKKFRDDAPHFWIDMLEDLVLWNVVSQCAGTLTHSPEKV